MKILIPTLATLVVGVTGYSRDKIEQAMLTPGEIRDAIAADLPGWDGVTLPKAKWPERILQIKPLRVYTHRSNRVIALSQRDNVESGYYVYVIISSYLPQDNQEWTFRWVEENIWTYTRKLGAPHPRRDLRQENL